MKTFRYFYLLAALTAFSACSNDDDEVQGQGSATNADKVLINAVVDGNSLFTRSNPMGANDASQQIFNQGDKLAVGCGDELPVVYTMGADKNWATEGEDGLAWAESYPEAVAYHAYYPAVASVSFNTFILPADQSSNENITNADYMTGTTEISERPADGVLKLNMNRRMARVIIKIAGMEEGLGSVTSLTVNSQYAAISPVNVEGPVKSITPYAMGNDTYAALVIPGEGSNTETFVEVGTTTGGTRKITGIKPAEAGKSYTYDLYVGERGATLSDPIVEDWTEGTLQGTLTVKEMKQLDRTGWTATGKYEERRWNYGGKFSNLLDGSEHTFWSGDWGGAGAKDIMPIVVIDTKKENYFSKIGLMHHYENKVEVCDGHNYAIDFYVCSDPKTWWDFDHSAYWTPERCAEDNDWQEFGWQTATNWKNRTNWIKVGRIDEMESLHRPAYEYFTLDDTVKGRYFIIEFTSLGRRNIAEFSEVVLFGMEATE